MVTYLIFNHRKGQKSWNSSDFNDLFFEIVQLLLNILTCHTCCFILNVHSCRPAKNKVFPQIKTAWNTYGFGLKEIDGVWNYNCFRKWNTVLRFCKVFKYFMKYQCLLVFFFKHSLMYFIMYFSWKDTKRRGRKNLTPMYGTDLPTHMIIRGI